MADDQRTRVNDILACLIAAAIVAALVVLAGCQSITVIVGTGSGTASNSDDTAGGVIHRAPGPFIGDNPLEGRRTPPEKPE